MDQPTPSPAAAAGSTSPTLQCVIGFDYVPKSGTPLRFEPGDTITGIPAAAIRSARDAGAITDTNTESADG